MLNERAANHTPSLYADDDAHRRWELARRDNTEITSILGFLDTLPDPALAGLRVLELACGSGRTTVPMAAAGHRVLATDISIDVLNLLADRLKERRAIQSGAADRIELRQADMVSFNIKELFKAVCLPMASISLLNPEQRRAAIRCMTAHMAIGGTLITSIDHVLPEAAETSTIQLQPDTYLTEEINQVSRRRRTICAAATRSTSPSTTSSRPRTSSTTSREPAFSWPPNDPPQTRSCPTTSASPSAPSIDGDTPGREHPLTPRLHNG